MICDNTDITNTDEKISLFKELYELVDSKLKNIQSSDDIEIYNEFIRDLKILKDSEWFEKSQYKKVFLAV